MKFFMNKNIWSKIVIVLVFILLFQFVATKPSLGANTGIIDFGGKLLEPIMSFIVTLADGAVNLIHSSIMDTENATEYISTSSAGTWKALGTVAIVVGGIIGAIASIVAIPFTGGASAAGFGAIVSAALPWALGTIAVCTIWNVGVGDYAVNKLGLGKARVAGYSREELPGTIPIPAYTISPEEIFEGKIELFNINFFEKPKTIWVRAKNGKIFNTTDQEEKAINEFVTKNDGVDHFFYVDDGEEIATSRQNSAKELRGLVSRWYVAIRNIAIVCMMIVLLYIGIRILLSTIASDKAKYKQMLQDWAVGMVILFTMHYIMVFSVGVVGQITKLISTVIDKQIYAAIIPNDSNGKVVEAIKDMGLEEFIVDKDGNAKPDASGGEEAYVCYPGNLMCFARIRASLANHNTENISYSIVFIILVIYTAVFGFTYLKRVLYMAFLTMIAPMVALTYPIDKLNDGKAQGFNKWFREYVFNLLIQPLHLLLYYILVTSAFELASSNVIYTLVAIGFMIPAEKLLRSFFGVDKSATAPPLGAGLAVGAMALSMFKPKRTTERKNKKEGEGEKSGDNIRTSSMFDSNEEYENSLMDLAGQTGQLPQANAGMPSTQENTETQELPESVETPELPESTETGAIPANTGTQAIPANTGTQAIPATPTASATQAVPTTTTISAPPANAGISSNQSSQAKPTIKKPSLWKRARANGLYHARKYTPKVLKAGAKFAAGVAGGTIGLAAGVATGDLSKVGTYASGGAVLASKMTGGAINRAGNVADKLDYKNLRMTPKEIKERRINTNEKYKDVKEYYKMRESKEESAKYFATKLDNDQMRELMKNEGLYEKLYANNIKNKEEILKAVKMKDKEKLDNDQTVLRAKMALNIGNITPGSKQYKDQRETIEKTLKAKGLNESDASKQADSILDGVIRFHNS